MAKRYFEESSSGQDFLKSGIQTRNNHFNQMIAEIERVALRSKDPILLQGPTGAGKTQLARRIYELKSMRKEIKGSFVPVNCATLKGAGAMSALFGHYKGAYTGAVNHREGYLRHADKGILFLDEIGELGLDEQAMLLHALEEKSFYPLGSDKAVSSDFQLLAGTNRNLRQAVQEGRFREDLLSRIDIWCWRLPALKERLEDMEANIDFELHQHTRSTNKQVRFNKAARERYLNFATTPDALWSSNFRDLNASINRMVTLSEFGRIDEANVVSETERLSSRWHQKEQNPEVELSDYLDEETLVSIDHFDKLQLMSIINVCQQSRTLAEAGRKLFDVSRSQKASVNDSHRLRTYLKKFGLDFKSLTT
ncbi:sigma 54-interacting transcriptional regulator [Endozoicomonas lisbonensis]|uniref:Sigma54-dependent transcription regulator n=1 Tax=Endozoicomonas lisbonensis TaxID=3120522 RepID=A0ABV2SL47_9GAMM